LVAEEWTIKRSTSLAESLANELNAKDTAEVKAEKPSNPFERLENFARFKGQEGCGLKMTKSYHKLES